MENSEIFDFFEELLKIPGCNTDKIYTDWRYTLEDYKFKNSLDLSHLNVSYIPESIENLYLTKLCINERNLKNLPESLGNLKYLEKFTLNNFFHPLPDYLGKFENLEYLNLNSNNLDSVPIYIKNMKNLSELCLENNNLRSIPDFLCNLDELKILRLNSNFITQIPDSIGNLKNLSYLGIMNNLISSFPESARLLENLEVLEIGNNPLISIPDIFYDLRNLTWLNIENTGLANLDFLDNANVCLYKGCITQYLKLYLNMSHLPIIPEKILAESIDGHVNIYIDNIPLKKMISYSDLRINMDFKKNISNNSLTQKHQSFLDYVKSLKKIDMSNDSIINHITQNYSLINDEDKNEILSKDLENIENFFIDYQTFGCSSKDLYADIMSIFFTAYLKKNRYENGIFDFILEYYSNKKSKYSALFIPQYMKKMEELAAYKINKILEKQKNKDVKIIPACAKYIQSLEKEEEISNAFIF